MSVPAGRMQQQTANDSHAAVHGGIQALAGAAAKMASAKTDPHPDLVSMLSGIHGKLDQLGAGGQPDAGGGGQASSPQEQAVWDAFPSTDPTVLDHLAQSSGGPEGMIGPLLQMMAADEQHLHDLQMQQVSAVLAHLTTPDQSTAGGEPSPQVGGEQSGY